MTHEWLNKLQSSGYRITGPLRTIVQIIADSKRAMGALDVFETARRQYPGLGLVTVYRTLEKLESLDLVQRVHQPNGCHAYLPASHGHEHILLCTVCGHAEYFTGDNLAPLMNDLADKSGFEIRDHWLQLFGLCQACRGKQTAD